MKLVVVSIPQLPKWDRESSNVLDSNIGPSVQAQPSNVPSDERTKSSSSGSGQTDGRSPTESSQTSSRSGTVDGSPTSSAPQSSSSSGTTSSTSGYPPSSSPDNPPPSGNQRGTPRSEGTDSQQPHPTDDASDGSGRERKGESQAHPTEEDMDTTSSSQIEASDHRGTSQTDGNLAEGTQDSFLGRKNQSGSFSSCSGVESGYSAGSSSASVLVSATCSVSMLTTKSQSAPLSTVSDSQKTVENSVSCVEDSVPLSSDEMKSVSKFPHKTGALESVIPAAVTHQTISRLDESKEIGKADLLKHKKVNRGCESDNSSECHLLIESLKAVVEQQINKDISSELLPVENPQSPELLNDVSVETINEDMMDTPNSPEIAIQALKLPQNRSLFQTVYSTEIKESHTNTQTVTNVKKSCAKSSIHSQALVEDAIENSQAMETDMVSIQSSFVLQLTESQCSLAPVSPMKSDISEAGEEGWSSKNDGVVVASLEEIEEYEKEFPSLVKVQQHDEETVKDGASLPSEQEAAVNVIDISKQHDSNNSNKPSDCMTKPTNIRPITSNNESGSDGSKLQLDALAKAKPIPLYESLECDDSVGMDLSNPVVRAQLKDESQQSGNTSQGTGSGEYCINTLGKLLNHFLIRLSTNAYSCICVIQD